LEAGVSFLLGTVRSTVAALQQKFEIRFIQVSLTSFAQVFNFKVKKKS
jgi:hypothetical protein